MSKVATIACTRSVAAVIIAFALGMQAWADLRYGTFTWAQLPGYFTPLAALAAVVALIAATVTSVASGLNGGADSEPRWVSLLRVNAATYGVITGAVYWSYLAGVASPVYPWANIVLHGGAGAILVADWLLVGGREPLPLSTVWTVLVVPALWLGYLLVRAHVDGWVPYAFLDPARGTLTIMTTVATIGAIGVLIAGGLHLSTRRHADTTARMASGTRASRGALTPSRSVH